MCFPFFQPVLFKPVMAALVAAIHVFDSVKSWMPAQGSTRPDMTK
jgi:hypothetical protein